jgi:glycosyltransferase involved in cell wall biosynthesis
LSPVRVVILNNQIMPYRIPLFTALYQRRQINPYVLYSAKKEMDRAWSLDMGKLPYPHKILPGISISLPKSYYGEWRVIWLNPTLFAELVRFKPQVIIAYEYSVPALTALLYSRLAGCRYITWTEMTAHTDRNLTFGQRLTRKIIASYAHAYLATSTAAKANLESWRIASERIVVAPQTFDVEYFRRESEHWRRQFEQREQCVVYAGQLIERKGVTHLLQSFRLVLKQMPNAVLNIAGSGKEFMALKTQVETWGIQNQVVFSGFTQPQDMPRIYAQGNIFVLPSLEDTFGLVAAEAMASGLSVICSKYAGFSSHLTDEHNAFVVDPEDHEWMAQRMIQLLRDDNLRFQFQQNSLPLLEQFTPEYNARQFEKAVEIAFK